jgi:hypothetical protein
MPSFWESLFRTVHRPAPESKLDKRSIPPRYKSKVKVKIEPTDRNLRRKKHKIGFYNVQNLTKLAWRGKGTRTDPIIIL